MRAVSSEGTTTHTSARFPRLFPRAPVSAMTFMPLPHAARIASMTFFDEPLEYTLESIVIAKRGQGRGIDRERYRGHSPAIFVVPADELRRKMLAISGGAAVAACKYRAALTERSADDARRAVAIPN